MATPPGMAAPSKEPSDPVIQGVADAEAAFEKELANLLAYKEKGLPEANFMTMLNTAQFRRETTIAEIHAQSLGRGRRRDDFSAEEEDDYGKAQTFVVGSKRSRKGTSSAKAASKPPAQANKTLISDCRCLQARFCYVWSFAETRKVAGRPMRPSRTSPSACLAPNRSPWSGFLISSRRASLSQCSHHHPIHPSLKPEPEHYVPDSHH